jgi:hypothetical protein
MLPAAPPSWCAARGLGRAHLAEMPVRRRVVATGGAENGEHGEIVAVQQEFANVPKSRLYEPPADP